MAPTTSLPDPSPLFQLLSGLRVNAALIAAMELRICGHLADGPRTVEEVAERAGVAPRGTQALLDALTAFGLCQVEDGRYRNGPLADAYLVPGRPTYLGDEEAAQFHAMLPSWSRFTDIVRSGEPAREIDSPEMLKFWTVLTPAIGRRQRPLAEEAIRWLGLDHGEVSLLDVGGGAAVFSLALLRQNPHGKATQLDWPHINKIAAADTEAAGVQERFHTIDGDFRKTPPGEGYDLAVLSNIVHQESPQSATELMKRLREALKPSGRLLVSEFLVNDGRSGPPHALLFNLNMLMSSRGGKSYERAELTGLFVNAGFEEPSFKQIGPVSTLAVAGRAR